MPDHRDDCPTAFNLARRDVLGALLIGGIAAFPRAPDPGSCAHVVG
jgi:hypothetical protein